MGIPNLTSTLLPFAKYKVLQSGDTVVIDGPALAYHILNICNRDDQAHPSYDILGETTIRWLDEFTDRGIDM